MKRTYLVLSLVGLISIGTSAQSMPGEYRAPTLRLMEGPHAVRVGNYSQRPPETSVDFAGTALMPKAHGTAKVASARGGFKIQVHLEGLGPAPQVDPAYLTYVLWAIPMNRTPQNMGELVLQGDESTLNTFTNFATFAMIVTAEPY